MFKVDNAIIMAAGTASRFAPLSFEKPKSLITVKGEVLIERQIKQLQAAGITQIYIVVGYKKEQFYYLKDKYNVQIIENDDFLKRNNNGSIYAAKDVIKNSYICSSDNYFNKNPFETEVDESYYAALYADGKTNEWCMKVDDEDYISEVKIGGEKSWYMLGHVFWSQEFSKKFLQILNSEYSLPETKNALWEQIFINHLSELKMKIRKYDNNDIYEFDTLDELREFDGSYKIHSDSKILSAISLELNCNEGDIKNIQTIKEKSNESDGFSFELNNKKYKYIYSTKKVEEV